MARPRAAPSHYGTAGPGSRPPGTGAGGSVPGDRGGQAFLYAGDFSGKGGKSSDARTPGQPEARGQGGGKSFQQPRRRPSDSLTEISAKFGAGICFFSKRQPRGRQAGGRRLLDVLDVLQPSAGNHAAAGRPRARSATTGGRICRPGALELSKVNAPRRRIPGNAAISPAGTAGGIGKSKHPSASIVIFVTP